MLQENKMFPSKIKKIAMWDFDCTIAVSSYQLFSKRSACIPNFDSYIACHTDANLFSFEYCSPGSPPKKHLLYANVMDVQRGQQYYYIAHAEKIYLALLRMAVDDTCAWCIITAASYLEANVANFLKFFIYEFTQFVLGPSNSSYLSYQPSEMDFIKKHNWGPLIDNLFSPEKFSFYNRDWRRQEPSHQTFANSALYDPAKQIRFQAELQKHDPEFKFLDELEVIFVEDKEIILELIKAFVKEKRWFFRNFLPCLVTHIPSSPWLDVDALLKANANLDALLSSLIIKRRYSISDFRLLAVQPITAPGNLIGRRHSIP